MRTRGTKPQDTTFKVLQPTSIFSRYLLSVLGTLTCTLFTVSGGSAAPKNKIARTKVTFWHATHDTVGRENIQKIIDGFNRSQNEVEVVNNLVSGSSEADLTDVTKLMVAVASGTGPDLYLMDRFTVAERASQLLLEDLSPLIQQADPQMAQNYLPFAWNEVTYNKKVYGIPTNTDTRALYLRTDILEKEKIPLGTILKDGTSLNLETLLELAKKLDKEDANGQWTRLGLIPWAGQGSFFTWSVIYGASLYDENKCQVTADHPGMIASMQLLARYIESRGGKKMRSFAAKALPENLSFENHPFITGEVPLVIEGSWFATSLKKSAPKIQFTQTFLPTHDGRPRTWSGGWSVVMPKGVKHKEAAFRFLRYYAGTEGQTQQMAMGRLPTIKALLQGKNDFFMRYLEHSMSRPPLAIGASLWKDLSQVQSDIISGDLALEAIPSRLSTTNEALNKRLRRFCSLNESKP